MKVRLNNNLVLDQAIHSLEKPGYEYTINEETSPTFKFGEWMELPEGRSNHIQILIGDDGGACAFYLLVEEKGQTYAKAPQGSPILPLFKVSTVRMPAMTKNIPPYDPTYLGWTIPGDDQNSDHATENPSTN